jgi:hypothetical protein
MRVERTTAAILNEPFEFAGVPRFAAAAIFLIVACAVVDTSHGNRSGFVYHANAERQAALQMGSGFLFLIPAIVFFYIHRVFDPFEWEPFGS